MQVQTKYFLKVYTLVGYFGLVVNVTNSNSVQRNGQTRFNDVLESKGEDFLLKKLQCV